MNYFVKSTDFCDLYLCSWECTSTILTEEEFRLFKQLALSLVRNQVVTWNSIYFLGYLYSMGPEKGVKKW